jgi:hypothetical protein
VNLGHHFHFHFIHYFSWSERGVNVSSAGFDCSLAFESGEKKRKKHLLLFVIALKSLVAEHFSVQVNIYEALQLRSLIIYFLGALCCFILPGSFPQWK